jgi:hypothetical protein
MLGPVIHDKEPRTSTTDFIDYNLTAMKVEYVCFIPPSVIVCQLARGRRLFFLVS